MVSSFNKGISNNHPDGAVILYQGALYGTTVYGDLNPSPNSCINATNSEIGCGSVFKVTLGAQSSPPGGGNPSDGDGDGDDGVTGEPGGGGGQVAPRQTWTQTAFERLFRPRRNRMDRRQSSSACGRATARY